MEIDCDSRIDGLKCILSANDGYKPITMRMIKQEFLDLTDNEARILFEKFGDSVTTPCLKIFTVLWTGPGEAGPINCGLFSSEEMENMATTNEIRVKNVALYCVLGAELSKIPFSLIHNSELNRLICPVDHNSISVELPKKPVPDEDCLAAAAQMNGLSLNEVKSILNKYSCKVETTIKSHESTEEIEHQNTSDEKKWPNKTKAPTRKHPVKHKATSEIGKPAKKMKQSSMTSFFCKK